LKALRLTVERSFTLFMDINTFFCAKSKVYLCNSSSFSPTLHMRFIILYSIFLMLPILSVYTVAAQPTTTPTIVVFDIKEEIAPSATRLVSKALKTARDIKADLIVIHMDTYGGLVTDADSIRYAILTSPIPVVVHINPNAASAGALISIACERIYMAPGASIGAATVVTQDGTAAPDKFQSYMRSIMRSTAKAKGKIINANGDSIWRRNPDIAEAMVDQDIEISNVSEKGKVLTFTPDEAMKNGFCDGVFASLNEVIRAEGFENAAVVKVEKDITDIIFGFLKNPAVTGVLILLVLGGIYYELQSPGLGFPIIVSITAAVLYFLPNYIDGLAENWEIILFLLGIVLLGLEIFVIPGFGVAGVAGALLMISSLVLSMVGNQGFDFQIQSPGDIGRAFMIVTLSMTALIVLMMVTGVTLHRSSFFKKMSLEASLEGAKQNVWIGDDAFLGQVAITHTEMRPGGKILFENKLWEARALVGYIKKGEKVKMIRKDNNIWLIEVV
jgi:membrane-bound serine protease (ClpP class)